MTKQQRIALQSNWWPAACRAQGWKVGDRDLRLRVCSWAVTLENPTWLELLEAINSDRTPERQLTSTNDLNNKEDVDRVKACLGMLADNTQATGEVGHPEIGRARRLRDIIRDQIKCIGIYQTRPAAYVAEIVNDKFNRAKRMETLTIQDLTDDPIILRDGREIPSQLDQLVMTLGGCLNGSGKGKARLGFRVAAGHTLHEMKTLAGVRCDCRECGGRIPSAAVVHDVCKKAAAEEDWTDFEPEPETGAVEEPF